MEDYSKENILKEIEKITQDENVLGGIQFSGEPIEDVNTSTIKYAGRYLKKHIYYVIGLVVVAIFLFAYGVATQNYFLRNFFIFPLILLFALYGWIRSFMQSRFMLQFAREKGLSYSEGGDMNGLSGALFKLGHSRDANNFIAGQLEGSPIKLFLYSYQTGSGKQTTTHNYTVFHFPLSVIMPDILLAQKMSFLEKWPNQEAVTLEGNFNEHFTFYAEKEYEIEALQIFTPDTMAELIDQGKDYSLEIIGNQLYVYLGKKVTNRKDLYAMYNFARFFNEKMKLLSVQMKPSLEAMEYVEKT